MFEEQLVVVVCKVDLATVERPVEGSIDMRSRPGLDFRRQKNHENSFIGLRRFLDGDAHGNLTDLRPSVRQVLHDGSDSLCLHRIFVSAKSAGPYLELASCVALGRRLRMFMNQQPLLPGPWAVRELDVRIDHPFQGVAFAIDLDAQRLKMRQEDRCPGIQFLKLIHHGPHCFLYGAGPATIQRQPDDGYVSRTQQLLHIG